MDFIQPSNPFGFSEAAGRFVGELALVRFLGDARLPSLEGRNSCTPRVREDSRFSTSANRSGLSSASTSSTG